jgi:prepilin-type processing-associated H-X9-DG protein
VAANRYETGSDAGDNRALFAGYSSSNVRWAYDPPAQDQTGVSRPNVFGSAHRAGWNVSFADGSVRTMDFDVDATIHAGLAARADNRIAKPLD